MRRSRTCGDGYGHLVEPLQVAAWRWVTGDQPAEDLPALATDALVRGLDSPALRELAGTATEDYWAIKDHFERTAHELDLAMPDEQTALWRLTRYKAEEIVSGAVSPSSGAHWVWREVWRRIEREGDLRIFVALADEWDDHPDDRREIEAQIIEAAKALLRQAEPRTWVRVQARWALSPIAQSRSLKELPIQTLPISTTLMENLEPRGVVAGVRVDLHPRCRRLHDRG